MALTDHSDLFAAAHEDGINILLRHIMQQRPSLFNYGTQLIADDPKLLCKKIDPSPMVTEYQNPLIKVVDPLPLIPINDLIALNFVLQVTELQIDFNPGSVFNLPNELGNNGQLPAHHFALRGQVCGGIGCPSEEEMQKLRALVAHAKRDDEKDKPRRDIYVPHIRELTCFCIELFAVGHFEPTGPTLDTMFRPKIDGIEIVDIRPDGLESALECYLKLLVELVLLPQLSDAIGSLFVDDGAGDAILGSLQDLTSHTVVPTPISADVPHNPDVSDDRLMLRFNLEEV